MLVLFCKKSSRTGDSFPGIYHCSTGKKSFVTTFLQCQTVGERFNLVEYSNCLGLVLSSVAISCTCHGYELGSRIGNEVLTSAVATFGLRAVLSVQAEETVLSLFKFSMLNFLVTEKRFCSFETGYNHSYFYVFPVKGRSFATNPLWLISISICSSVAERLSIWPVPVYIQLPFYVVYSDGDQVMV